MSQNFEQDFKHYPQAKYLDLTITPFMVGNGEIRMQIRVHTGDVTYDMPVLPANDQLVLSPMGGGTTVVIRNRDIRTVQKSLWTTIKEKLHVRL